MNSKQHAHIKDLSHDPKNARKHTPRNVGTIVSALHEVGAARSIVIDEDGVVLAGNATLDAAAEAGITRLRVIETDGQELVAVKRTGLTAEQKTRLALYDNRAAELAEWDVDVLRDLVESNMVDGMFTAEELGALIPELMPSANDDAIAIQNDIKYLVMVECTDEQAQQSLFQELQERGYSCKLID